MLGIYRRTGIISKAVFGLNLTITFLNNKFGVLVFRYIFCIRNRIIFIVKAFCIACISFAMHSPSAIVAR